MTAHAARRISTRIALSAPAAAILLAISPATPPAAAADHTIWFQFANERPGGETVTAYVLNQGKVADVPNGSLTEIASDNFATYGQPSTGHYDVRISARGNAGHEYCDFHATATYRGTSGVWDCSVQYNGTGHGATCVARRSRYYPVNYPCVFEFDVK